MIASLPMIFHILGMLAGRTSITQSIASTSPIVPPGVALPPSTGWTKL
jgi:hypothetical protein